MIVFIIPIKSIVTDAVYRLLKSTLRSIYNIEYNVQVITVSNIKLQIYNELNITTDVAHPDRPEFDKVEKIRIGFAASVIYNPNYLMVFDYDDYVSRRLGQYISTTQYGYYLESGYIYENQQELYLQQINFYHYCGSGLIVRPSFLPQLLDYSVYSHFQNSLLEPIYEPLVVYNRCNGENLVARKAVNKADLLPITITQDLLNDFNLCL